MTDFQNAPIKTVEDAKQRFLLIRLVHAALVIGVATFGIVVIILKGKQLQSAPVLHPAILMSVVMSVGAIMMAALFPKIVAKGTLPNADAAFRKYFVLFLIRASLVEGAALFAGVATLISGSVLSFVVFWFCVAVLVMLRPTPAKLLAFSRTSTENNWTR